MEKAPRWEGPHVLAGGFALDFTRKNRQVLGGMILQLGLVFVIVGVSVS